MDRQTRSDVALLYRRAGFGLGAQELDRVADGGYEAAVGELMAGLGAAPDPAGDQVTLPEFAPFTRVGGIPSAGTGTAVAQARRAQEAGELAALQRWWMDRMIVTSTPLREKLTLFWHGHFATGASKVRDARLMYLQNHLFRTAGGGGFEALTQAVAKDGAMMVWLDTATDKKAHPNENFAREMMELFTLGLGQYTQSDVTSAARAFTGWAYDRTDDRYRFHPRQHDFGSKTYLGQIGDWNGEDIVHIAVTCPPSARFVVAKLWSHFAYPVEPSDPVIEELLPAYGDDLEVGSALRAIFLSPHFRSSQTRTGLVKQPIEYLVGAARILGLDASLAPADASTAGPALTGSAPAGPAPAGSAPAGSAPVGSAPVGSAPAGPTPGPTAKAGPTLPSLAAALGQIPFNPPNVGGWGQNAYWLDTATTRLRLQIALLLAHRADLRAVQAMPESERVAGVADLLGIDGWGSTTAAALDRVAGHPQQVVALSLTAPEYVLA